MKTFIKQYELKNQRIQKRIVLISDIHYYIDTPNSYLLEIRKKINDLNPSYICIAGDIVDLTNVRDKMSAEPLYQFLKDLGNMCPVIMVLGNHDVKAAETTYYEDPILLDELRSIPNVHLLRNKGIEFEDIYFMGYEPSFQYYEIEGEKNRTLFLKEAKGKIKASKKYSVLLIHTPIHVLEDYYEPLHLEKFSLILSGHTHNGLVPSWIHGNRGLVSPIKTLFPKNIRGKMEKGSTTLIVTGGIMKLSYCSGFFHHFSNFFKGEITCIDLK